MNFKELHTQESPLLLCNIWDVASAKIAEKLSYSAIGTSSAAVAAMLGYEDGEEMNFGELKFIVERIVKSISIPLTVDLEAGYSRNPDQIISNIIQLSSLGVKGINIEDSLVEESRKLIDINIFSDLLAKICSSLKEQNQNVFINVRTHAYLLGIANPLQETITRAIQYQKAGANGIFVPKIIKAEDIKSVIENINLPLNVMCVPDLPDFDELQNLGVKRISMGPFPFLKAYKSLEQELSLIQENNTSKNLFI